MNSTELNKLIQENPGLPIYAFVYPEVVGETDSSFCWLGRSIGARISEIAFVEPYGYYNRIYVEKYDLDDYVEYLLDQLDKDIPTDEDIDNAYKKARALDFKKVILLSIDTLERN